MAGTIGIKIANGDFYPIIEENSSVKKRLVLTTVHDKQSNLQIDLFRSISKSMLDAQYIGSLIVKTNSTKPKGDPSIEMVISVDRNGNINAEAYDLDAGSNGERHTLNVSLQNMDTLADIDNAPDFEFNSHKYSKVTNTGDERRFPWLVMGLATLFVALVIAVLWFFFFGGRDVFLTAGTYDDPAPRPPVRQETQPIQEQAPLPPPPPPPPPPEPAVSQPTVIKAPESPPPARQTVKRVRPPAPVMSYRVPAVIPKNGVVYQIQWGDTLWDISAAFYRNPWLYSRIAKDNKIRNPDLIIAGSNVRIYPK
jgi:nucleoid-associated protein YgaU